MATEVVMPKMGYDMTEGTLLRWIKREGDDVAKGEVLGEIETGKVNIEIEAFDDGVLRTILVGEGETVPVGAVIAVIAGSDEPLLAVETAPPIAPAEGHPSGEAAATDRRLRASPLARRLAEGNDLPLDTVSGSGPGGRIVRDDVLAALESGTSASPKAPPAAGGIMEGERTLEPLSAMRRTIARRLTESWTSAPHVFLTIDVDMTEALRLRASAIAAGRSGVKISINDVVLLATARTLRKDPRLNASLRDGSRVQHDRIHLGVAVALDDGLFTVVLPDADTMRLSEIASEVSSRATRAREGRLAATDVAVGSTFTVSNLGMYGVGTFTAVINPPEVAILAVGAVAPAPVVMDGDVAVRSLMTPTLSIDHRVVDGAVGAEFLAALKEALEDPIGLLV